MSAIKGTTIEGDVAIGRHVATGGDAKIQGSATVKKNLKVEGWLEATNIKGPDKGMFRTLEELEAAYPNPQDGWFAMVGDVLPAPLYMAVKGMWLSTGRTVGEPTLDIKAIEDHEERIQDLEDEVAANEITGISTLGNERQESLALVVQTTGKNHMTYLPKASGNVPGLFSEGMLKDYGLTMRLTALSQPGKGVTEPALMEAHEGQGKEIVAAFVSGDGKAKPRLMLDYHSAEIEATSAILSRDKEGSDLVTAYFPIPRSFAVIGLNEGWFKTTITQEAKDWKIEYIESDNATNTALEDVRKTAEAATIRIFDTEDEMLAWEESEEYDPNVVVGTPEED